MSNFWKTVYLIIFALNVIFACLNVSQNHFGNALFNGAVAAIMIIVYELRLRA